MVVQSWVSSIRPTAAPNWLAATVQAGRHARLRSQLPAATLTAWAVAAPPGAWQLHHHQIAAARVPAPQVVEHLVARRRAPQLDLNGGRRSARGACSVFIVSLVARALRTQALLCIPVPRQHAAPATADLSKGGSA